MFISVCLECYDGEKGDITGVNRLADDGSCCKKCGEPEYYVYTDRNNASCTGDYLLISASLAISPSQIKAHKKSFPDVGVFPDGRLGFTSFHSHDKYCEKTGFVKHTQKIRIKGKIIG